MKPYLAYGLVVLLLGGCASTPSVSTVQVLENTGTEFPTMCMLLQADGSLVFRGGFAFYNPSSWRKAGDDVVVMTLGGKEPFPTELYKAQLPKHIGGLAGYNEKRRELAYRFGPSAEFVNFDGFYFYRAERCHA